VPATFSHVSAVRRATVGFDPTSTFTTLTPTELARLPASLATYDPGGATTPTCGSNYCHGSGTVGAMLGGTAPTPQWTNVPAPVTTCTSCHGNPPASASPLMGGGDLCASTCNLHVGHAQNFGCAICHAGSAPANASGHHVNGKKDVVWGSGITGNVWDPTLRMCGVSCHSDVFPRGW
jgi:predicted CxxxxCH...CXXCH cytochrome family protein